MICLVGGLVRVEAGPSPSPLAPLLVALVSSAALPLRHRSPVFVLAATTAGGLLVQPFDLVMSPVIVAPAVLAAYAFAFVAVTERQAAVAISLSSAVLLVAAVPWSGQLSWQDVSRMAAVAAFPLVAGVLGRFARNRRAYLEAVRERAVRAENDREDEARRRVAQERLRIARELHDLVAHQITLANAQATVAAHVFDTRPEQSRKSMDQLVETTRHALDDLRTTVGLLRQTDDPAGPTEPAPGLSQLPTLLESFRRTGLEVSLSEEGPAGSLPPGTDLSAYRIVQEALTNVTKHAGPAGRAEVLLAWSPERLTLTVTDDPDGRPRTSTIAKRPPGYGLVGMRERAIAAGGELSAGPRPEGGFRVVAQLPVRRGKP